MLQELESNPRSEWKQPYQGCPCWCKHLARSDIESLYPIASYAASADNVSQVFLTDMKNFAEMNAEYEKWFTHKPARSCVAVYQLPKGVPVEIEAIAVQ